MPTNSPGPGGLQPRLAGLDAYHPDAALTFAATAFDEGLRTYGPDYGPALEALRFVVLRLPPGWDTGAVLRSLAEVGPAARDALPFLYRWAADWPLAHQAVTAVEARTDPCKLRLKLAVLPLLQRPGSSPTDVACALLGDTWLRGQLTVVAWCNAPALARGGRHVAEELVDDFYGWLYESRLARDKSLGFDLLRHANFVAFLKTIFRNHLHDERERSSRHRAAPDGQDLDQHPDTEDDLRKLLDREVLERILAFVHDELLPSHPHQASAVLLRVFGRLSCAETVARMGLTPDQVYRALKRGIAAIRRRFGSGGD